MPPQSSLVAEALDVLGEFSGEKITQKQLQNSGPPFKESFSILGLGKVAASMAKPFEDLEACTGGICLVPQGLASEGSRFQFLEGNHPVPGTESFESTKALIDYCESLPRGSNVLVLLSGGASSLLELPKDGITQTELVEMHQRWHTEPLSILELNRKRARISAVKAGGFGRMFPSLNIQTWVLSDVLDSPLDTVGSGPTSGDELIKLADARSVLEQLGNSGYEVTPQLLDADAIDCARQISEQILNGKPGKLAWGGEPKISMPTPLDRSRGGRLHHLALLVMNELFETVSERGFEIAFVASDGEDGSSGSAGVAFDSETLFKVDQSAVWNAIESFDSAFMFEQLDLQLKIERYATNLNDFVLLKTSEI